MIDRRIEMIKLVNHKTIYYLHYLSKKESSEATKEMVQNNNLSKTVTTRKVEDD